MLFMSISFKVRMILTAISPRFAIRTFFMSFTLFADSHQHLIVLDSVTVFHKNFFYDSRMHGIDIIENLHCFDEADLITFLDNVSCIDKVFIRSFFFLHVESTDLRCFNSSVSALSTPVPPEPCSEPDTGADDCTSPPFSM